MSASIRTPGYSLVSPCVGEQVLCIGATDLDDEVEIYSSLGPSIPPTGYDKPELFAPDCVTNATYAPSRFCGTSAAAPHAAGAAALYLQALDFDPTAVREVMLEETVPVGPGGQYGRVQASCTVGGLPDICETDPNAEICDGLDNDGDSARDEGLVDCAAPAASDPIGFFAETADLGEHVAYIDDVGDLHLLYYRWTDAGWRHFHVSDRFGLPPVEGEVHGWGSQETPWGDFLHLVFRDTSGDVHEVWYDVSNATTPPSYGWNHHVLTQMTGAPLATSDPIGNFAVTSQEKGEHVFYVDAAGHVIELYFMYDFGAWQGAPGAATWTWRDLTDDVHDCADGCPTASGGLDSWFTALPETYGYFQHVVYRDSDDHVHELYNCWWNENPFWDDWADHDLGAETGAPVATSDPSGYYSATDGLEAEHIMYTDANGEVVELYYVYAEQEWNWHSLSDLIGAPTAVTAPDGWYSPTGGDEWEHGIYTDLDGHVRELFYMFGSEDGWSQQSLTVESNCPPAIGKPSGYYSAVTDDQGEEKTEHVVFRAADGQVYEMYFLYADPGAGWHCHSLNPPTEY